jgi:hypothetical protein
MKVYLISNYGEYGSEAVRATLDKSKVRELLATHPDMHGEPLPKDYEQSLKRMLEADELADGHDLGRGWGGFQLHIVELE